MRMIIVVSNSTVFIIRAQFMLSSGFGSWDFGLRG